MFDLPTHFSRRVQNAIDNGTLADPEDKNRSAFVREVVSFYEPILPTPTPTQYEVIPRKIVEKYPCLKDAKTSKYWVSINNDCVLTLCRLFIVYAYNNGIILSMTVSKIFL